MLETVFITISSVDLYLQLMPNHVVPAEYFLVFPVRPEAGNQSSIVTMYVTVLQRTYYLYSRTFLKRPPYVAIKNMVSQHAQEMWSLAAGSVPLKCRTFCQDYMVLQDRWSLMAAVSQDRLHCRVISFKCPGLLMIITLPSKMCSAISIVMGSRIIFTGSSCVNHVNCCINKSLAWMSLQVHLRQR